MVSGLEQLAVISIRILRTKSLDQMKPQLPTCAVSSISAYQVAPGIPCKKAPLPAD